MKIQDQTTYSENCAWCAKRVEVEKPGAVYKVHTSATAVTVSIHNVTCRKAWFKENPPTKWVIVYRIGYEEEK